MRISKDPAVRRQEILDAAMALFAQNGAARTSMTEIAAKVGVAKGLVYYYFASKEQIVQELVDQFLQQLDEALQAIVSREDLNFSDKLAAVLVLYFQSFQRHSGSPVFSSADPGVFAQLRDRASGIALTQTATLLRQGMAQGLIRIEYPEFMLKVLIRGLGDLYLEGVSQVEVHATLVEQALGLKKGTLRLNFD